MSKSCIVFVLSLSLLFMPALGFSAEKKEARPAVVVVEEIADGKVEPANSLVGTIIYPTLSEVASELSGKVVSVAFEEGDRVRQGQILARLDGDIRQKTMDALKASRQVTLADLENARLEFNRILELYKKSLVAEQSYDTHRFKVMSLESKAVSQESEIERLKVEMEKENIKAPFDGIVIKKSVEKGEWLSPGSPVATLADDSRIEALVNVPEEMLDVLHTGMQITVQAGDRAHSGRINAIIPRGDVETRSFPVKVGVNSGKGLLEGMEARVLLPTGRTVDGLLVNRDAVIKVMGNQVIYTVVDDTATMVPVEVTGYQGLKAGVSGQGLAAGMRVVVKGHERLRPGQPVIVVNE